MNPMKANIEQITTVSGKHSRTQYVFWMCLVFSLLIVGRAVSGIMLYVFAAVAAVVFLFSNTSECIPFLMFFWPLANILKPDADSMSFYTLFYFIVVAKMVFTFQKVHVGLLVLELVYFVFCLLFSGLSYLTTIITTCAGFLLLYYLRQEDIDTETTIFMFTIGICLASTLALLKDFFPIIKVFVNDAVLKLGENQYADRFSGLTGNPNYYTMDITMALASFIVLMLRGKRQKLYIFCFIVLSLFGLMSISKSFLVSWIILIACWFFAALRKGIGGVAKFAFIITLLVAGVSLFAIDTIFAYISRLLNESQGGLDEITTGRTQLWGAYISAFLGDLKIFFFGSGINRLLPSLRGAHNTYIEGLYYLGLVGITLFSILIRISTNRILVSGIMWVPVLTFIVRLMAIGIFTNDSLWVYLIILVALSKACLQDANPQKVLVSRHTEEGRC